MKTFGNYIGGRFVDLESNETQNLYNPSTGEIVAKVSMSTKQDVEKAVLAAKEAAPQWAATKIQ